MKKLKRILSLVLVVCILSGMNILHIGGSTATAETLDSQAENSISETFDVSDNAEESVQQTEQLATELKENSNITDYVDEKTLVESKHVKRLKDKEKLNTYVFLNEDGTESVYYMEKNVKYKADNGVIREKDIKLVRKQKAYKVTDNDVKLSIPDTATDGIELGYKENNVKLVPKNSKSKANATLNENDNSVTYNNYFGNGIDLRYTPLLSGIKEDIILSSYTENSSFEFILYTNGLKIFSDQGNYYLAESANSEDKIYLGEIIVYDAVGRPDKGTLTIETVKAGSEYILTVSADEDFLKDPLTVYPVVIDPTLEISRETLNSNAILDATVFSGFPNQNFGSYQYCTLGQINTDYGVARTIVKFKRLINDAVYNSITADDITSAKYYVKEAAGVSSCNVSVLYNQSATEWDENTITWNTLSTQLSAPIATTNLNNNQWSYFDLTDYIKRCRTGELNISSGLVFKLTNSETSVYTQFYSAEHVTQEDSPYLVLKYTGDTSVQLNTNSIALDESGKYKLNVTVNPPDAQILWSTSNRQIATVDMSGNVSAGTAGVAYITAKIAGTHIFARCIVFVTIEDGIYTITNMDNGKVLDVANNGIANNTNVLLCPKNTYCGGINQIWRIKHLAQGYYSVRPLHKLDMCLYTEGADATIYYSNQTEHISSTPETSRWTITYEVIEGTSEMGYVFKGMGKTLTSGDIVNANDFDAVVETRNLADRKQYWILTANSSSPIGGSRLYDASTPGYFYDSNYRQDVSFKKELLLENGKSIEDLQLVPAFYSKNFNDTVRQNFQWLTSKSSVARVDNQSGYITPQDVGVAEITASNNANGTIYKVTFTVVVVEVGYGEYFIKNRNSGLYAQLDNDAAPDYNESGVILEHFSLDTNDYQKWEIVSLDNGYHKIVSKQSGLVISVEENDIDDENVALVQEAYIGAYRQQWKITMTVNGSYKIKARSSEGLSKDLVMAIGWDVKDDIDETNIEQREYLDNNSFKDEWFLYRIGACSSVEYETQQMDLWCWVTAARMFAKHYYPNISYKQQDAVREIKGTVGNFAGSINDTKDAINYYFSSAGVDEQVLVGEKGCVYSEDTLLRFLDDEHVVIVDRHKYSSLEDPNSEVTGHIILLHGYVFLNDKCYFLIKDSAVGSKKNYMMSYERLYNGLDALSDEQFDNYIWQYSIVMETDYADETIPYYFDREG